MKTVILYYTLGGSSKKEAERLCAAYDADICQVQEAKKRTLFNSYFPGCPNAMKRKASAIKPLGIDFAPYDKIVLVAPIWAGFPAPAFNAAVALLPKSKEVELIFCSGSGDSGKSKQGTVELIEKAGCTVVSYTDVKTGLPQKKK